jgi:rubrerythrin
METSEVTCLACGCTVFKTQETIEVDRKIFIDTVHKTGNRSFDKVSEKIQSQRPWVCGRCGVKVGGHQVDMLDNLAFEINFDQLNSLP